MSVSRSELAVTTAVSAAKGRDGESFCASMTMLLVSTSKSANVSGEGNPLVAAFSSKTASLSIVISG